ncbi:hypothetical protein [Streptomyces lancefieldiae]|uniref:Uncharacterized protein n=1 Tax=Streptomyces lancefieldiae TaxID=3075520 RepID=A0ABU3AFA3_9ACTN|nr:hypothetical protein [Streptomyces sp. DSM 40712]MDT0608858.1 hypothetical protein [Streptomyces sp. DSM 40712]
MALCRECSTPIPCHCHLTPPVETRPGVYLATEPHARQPHHDQPIINCPHREART